MTRFRISAPHLAIIIFATLSTMLAGCGASKHVIREPDMVTENPWFPTTEEQTRLNISTDTFTIVVVGGPDDKVLRQRARQVPESINMVSISAKMEKTMHSSDGVGLAGPQVGLSARIVVLIIGAKTETPRVVFARNPVIVSRSGETVEGYEGCLSIPGVGGLVRRNKRIIVQWLPLHGKLESQKFEGFDAIVWQHEIDHLDGILYTDKVLGELLPMKEVRRLRKETETQKAKPTPDPDTSH